MQCICIAFEVFHFFVVCLFVVELEAQEEDYPRATSDDVSVLSIMGPSDPS